jgi:hypothetical protein
VLVIGKVVCVENLGFRKGNNGLKIDFFQLKSLKLYRDTKILVLQQKESIS